MRLCSLDRCACLSFKVIINVLSRSFRSLFADVSCKIKSKYYPSPFANRTRPVGFNNVVPGDVVRGFYFDPNNTIPVLLSRDRVFSLDREINWITTSLRKFPGQSLRGKSNTFLIHFFALAPTFCLRATISLSG